MLAASLVLAALPPQGPEGADDGDARARIEVALRAYFAATRADGPELRTVLAAAREHEDLLERIVREKSFVATRDAVDRRGILDERYRFQDAESAGTPPSADNLVLFSGPAVPAGLAPLVVYVPDAITTREFAGELAEEREHGRFVLLVPDEVQDNTWNPSAHEHRRHTGPLRDLLLTHAIDPDRVYLVGSGRGGHATWDVGLLSAERFAGLFPCNGAPVHEGGFNATGGVFLENARSLEIATVYNTSFDHGYDECRIAGRKFAEWGFRFSATEEPDMRVMRIAEAWTALEDAVRDPHPREVRKRFNRLADGACAWLRALDRKPREWDPGARLTLRGRWPEDPGEQLEVVWAAVAEECALLAGSIAGDRVTVETQGVGRVRVFLDPELVDLGRPLTVVVDGKPQPKFTPRRSAEAMLAEVHATGDTSRLYWAFRDFDVPRKR